MPGIINSNLYSEMSYHAHAGFVINDVRSLTNGDLMNDQTVLPCPVGSLPCNATVNQSYQCLEERFWCDSQKDCEDGQDEEEYACC